MPRFDDAGAEESKEEEEEVGFIKNTCGPSRVLKSDHIKFYGVDSIFRILDTEEENIKTSNERKLEDPTTEEKKMEEEDEEFNKETDEYLERRPLRYRASGRNSPSLS